MEDQKQEFYSLKYLIFKNQDPEKQKALALKLKELCEIHETS